MSFTTCDCDHEVTDLIDEAFGLLEDGDLDGAEEVYAHATSHGDPCAELLTLGGCIAGERGAFEQALDYFEQALKQDPRFVVALVDAAELQLDAMEDAEGCLNSCERALPLTEDDPDARMDVLTYRARALIQLDREREAREAIEATKGLEVADPDALERVGSVAMALEAWDIAERAFSAALRIDPNHADAHYGLGWVHAEREDFESAAPHWLRTLALDEQRPPAAWSLPPAQFDAVVRRTLAELPERARFLLENVAVVVELAPGQDEVRDGLDPRVLGVFCGVPMDEQGVMDAAPSESNFVNLYQRNLEAACASREELETEIRITVLHETAHFFGLDDDDLEQIGLG